MTPERIAPLSDERVAQLARLTHNGPDVVALAQEVQEARKRSASESRVYDLLRYARHLLFTDGLISSEEFAVITADHPAVARLESYDAARQRIAELEMERDEALAVRDLAREASNRDLEAKRQAEVLNKQAVCVYCGDVR